MTNNSLPTAQPILATRRTDGAFLELVPSQSQPGLWHLVDPINRTCDCKGYSYRGTCSHLSALAPAAPAELLPCTGCRNYHADDEARRRAHPGASFDPGAAYLRAIS